MFTAVFFKIEPLNGLSSFKCPSTELIVCAPSAAKLTSLVKSMGLNSNSVPIGNKVFEVSSTSIVIAPPDAFTL